MIVILFHSNIFLKVPEEPDTWLLAQLSNRLSTEPPVWEPPPQIDRLREKIQGYCPSVSITDML